MFLDQTTGWLRWRENQGVLTDKKGNPIGGRRRNEKKGGGDRTYTLPDIKEIAKALRRAGVLDKESEAVVLARVEAFSKPVLTGRMTSNNNGVSKSSK